MGRDSIQVLHVDDEPDFADMAAIYLEREDERLDVETATSVREGLDRFAATDYDCVVCDYDMPHTNGIEFLERVRETCPDLPFVLFTGKGSEEVASEAISAGVTDYLQKEGGTGQYAVLANRIRTHVESYRTQRALEERTRRLELALRQTRSGIWAYDPETGMVSRYEAASDLWGSDANTTVPMEEAITERVHPEDRAAVRSALDATLSDGEPYRVEFRHDTPDGYRWAEARGDVVREGDDRGRLIAFTTDIHERKQRERELELYETMLETVPDGVYALDEDLRYLAVNQGMTDLTGYSREELIGSHLSLVSDEDAVEKARRQRERLTADGIDDTVVVADHPHLTAEGEVVPTEVRFRALPPADDGSFRGTAGVIRDVTERRDRERELERYETIIEASGDAVYALDADGHLTFVNDAFCEMVGHAEADLIGAHASVVMDDDDVERSEAVIRELLDGDDAHETVEMDLIRQDGERVTCETHIALLPSGDDGEFVGTTGVHRDITDRRRRERELEEYREYTDRLLDAIDDVFFVYDEAGTLQRWNESFAELTDYTDEELASMSALEFLPEQYRQRAAERIRDVFETGHARLEAPVLTRNGREIPYEYVADRVEHPDGEPRLVGIGRDVSERKRRERKLERDERIIRAMNDGVVVVEDGRITYTNPQVTEMVGYSPAELVDEPMGRFIAPEYRETVRRRFEERIGGEDPPGTYEIEILSKDGDRIPVEITVAQVVHGDRPATVSIVRDVAERKRRERELERQNERLEAFASVVSHDLRNPLNVAQGNVELAREACESEHLDTVAGALDRMDALLADLLTLAREGESVEERESVHLAALVEACWDNVETADATLAVETDRTIRADRSRLQQLLENLVSNAVEHGGDDVTVTVGDLDDGTGFYLADDGPGIPDRDRDEVFERGYSTVEDGTGFGLAIVAEIAEAHGWDVTVTESAGGGARFEITGVDTGA